MTVEDGETFWTVVQRCLECGEPATLKYALPTFVIFGWVRDLPSVTIGGVRAALAETGPSHELPGYTWRRQEPDAWVFTRLPPANPSGTPNSEAD